MRSAFSRCLALSLLLSPFAALGETEHPEPSLHPSDSAGVQGEHHDDEAGALHIGDADLERFGLRIGEAKPGTISEGIVTSGRIVPVDEKLAHVSPRFPGVIREVKAKVGDSVKPDSLLAVIQNNQNLQSFSLYPSISGTVIKRHATLGETVREEDVLFIVADLSEVWAELAVYKQDVDKVAVGQHVLVTVAAHLKPVEGQVIFFSPITEERTQSRLARVAIRHPDAHFSPGAFVSGRIATSAIAAPITVDPTAVQRIDGSDVVFVREGDTFIPRRVTLGRSDELAIEVLSGLKAGARYATGNTFVLKADYAKGNEEHEH